MPTINETLKQLEAHRNLAQKELAGLEAAINALRPLVDVPVSAAVKTVVPVAAAVLAQKGKMSDAAKAKIRAAMQARWAKVRAGKLLKVVPVSGPAKTVKPLATPAKPAAVPAKKIKMSAAGRANIQAATRARWAKYRAEKAKAKK